MLASSALRRSLLSRQALASSFSLFHSSSFPLSSGIDSFSAEQLAQIEEAGTFKHERVITTPQRGLVKVEEASEEVLNFCANNYLGLSDHPELIQAAKDALDTHGFGLSSVRFICGTQDIHKDLEKQISDFHGKEDTILYASCFDANAGIFETLLTPEDAVLSDSLNHASIIDGIRLCKARKYRYEHFDWDDLEAKLKDASDARNRMIVTDGVFSMDGDVCPLHKVVDLAKKYDATIMIDECHASGFLGPTGRGTPELFGVMKEIDIINSTLGKALGGASGGFTTGSKEIVGLLRQRSRPYLFSNSLAPPIVGASLKTFEILTKSTDLRDKLEKNTKQFRSAMTEAGFKLGGGDHPIVPIMLGDARLAADFSKDMLDLGIYVIGFSFPVVPKGKARIRVQISAGHTEEQVDRAIKAFVQVGKARGIIPN